MQKQKTLSNLNSDNAQWQHKWGFADTQFIVGDDQSIRLTGERYPLSGQSLPYILPFLEESLGIVIDWFNPRQEVACKPVSPSRRNESFCAALAEQFPSGCFSDDDNDRLRHSHGQTMIDEVNKVLYDRLERITDLVFYCESEADAQTLIYLAVKHNVCLVPYGGGTSVSRALSLPANEERMIVSVNMQRMNQVEWIDSENGRACVQAGITGRHLDEALGAAGFTCGHEPDSREFSTLGGWISTNASGMKKNRYGNIEDIVETINMATPAGSLTQKSPNPRNSMGIPLQSLFFGSEGNLGLITKAIIRIRPLPDVQKYGSLVFPCFEKGVEFMHELAQTSYVPASIRLVDNNQLRFGQALKKAKGGLPAWLDHLKKIYLSNFLGFSYRDLVAATLVMEGSKQEVAYQEKSLHALAKKHGGINGGAESGRRGYLLTYCIAYIGQFGLRFNLFGETFETTVPWDKIQIIREKVKAELEEQHNRMGLPGKPYLCSRVTQVYPTGVCMYFTVILYMKDVDNAIDKFSQIYALLRQAIIEHGGSISHHHGVGKLRKDFMKNTMSPASLALIRKVKDASDPMNTFGIRNNLFGSD